MKYNVIALQQADADVRHITRWIAERSLQGAESWLEAYEQLIARLAEIADSYPAALEDAECSVSLKGSPLSHTARPHLARRLHDCGR